MKKILYALLASIILSFLIISAWYFFFNYKGVSVLGSTATTLYTNLLFWLGVAIFSILFFVFFALPIALLLLKNQASNPNLSHS